MSISLAASKDRLPAEAVSVVERLLLLEDIEEKCDDWLDLNRRLVDFLSDAHLRLGYATFTDAAEKLGPDATIRLEWIKWRRTLLESLLNPSQVEIVGAPSVEVLSDDVSGSPNTLALRDAYRRTDWLRRCRGRWVIVSKGLVEAEAYTAHEDALGAAIDAHGMLGNFVCPYISDVYCHYKMRIYEAQAAFAQDIREL